MAFRNVHLFFYILNIKKQTKITLSVVILRPCGSQDPGQTNKQRHNQVDSHPWMKDQML